jgi:putative ABC transport system permease protein
MRINLFDIENWKEIGATLMRNKTRTFLTGFGIFWGTAMLAILLGGARGAKDMLMRNFDGFATNSGILFTNTTTIPYRGNAKGRAWELDETDMERLRVNIPELTTVTGMNSAYNVSSSHGRFSYSGNVNGVTPEYANVMLPHIYSGRFINEADVSVERKVAVVGQKVANELFPTNSAPIGEQILVNGISYSIIGIAGQTNEIQMNGRLDEAILLPNSTFQRAFKRGDKVNVIMTVARDNTKFADIIPRMRHIIYSRHTISPEDERAMEIFDISEKFEMVDNLFIGVELLALFIGLSTLLAGIIGIGNIMWVIVKERTQEIGIRRAIGAKPRDIIAQILSEGVALTAVAGLAGITFATIALAIAQRLTANEISTPQFQMNLYQALSIMFTFAILGTLAGLIPATKAMRIKPIEALNDK